MRMAHSYAHGDAEKVAQSTLQQSGWAGSQPPQAQKTSQSSCPELDEVTGLTEDAVTPGAELVPGADVAPTFEFVDGPPAAVAPPLEPVDEAESKTTRPPQDESRPHPARSATETK